MCADRGRRLVVLLDESFAPPLANAMSDLRRQDFTVGAAADPRALLEAAVGYACRHDAVRRRLAVVAAISDATKRTPKDADGRPNAEALAAAVAAAEAQTSVSHSSAADDGADGVLVGSAVDYSAMLQPVPGDFGWRVKLGHRALIDLCCTAAPRPASPSPAAADGPDGPAQPTPASASGPAVTMNAESFAAPLPPRLHSVVPVSAVLPTKCMYSFGSPDHNPMIAVASPRVLLRHLGASLRSRCAWRIQKDLARLHLVAHAAQMAGDGQTLRLCAGLLGEYD